MIENWWPVQIGYYDNPDHNNIEKNLVNYCLKLKKKYNKGGNFWVSTDTYNTSDNVYDLTKDEKFEKLNNFVNSCIEKFINESGIIFKVSNSNGWFNVYEKGDYQEFHDHNGYVISAVYFLKSEKNSSKLFFSAPFKDQYNINHKHLGFNINAPLFYESIPGRLVIFRSYLSHCVEKHKLKNKRITLAYNFK